MSLAVLFAQVGCAAAPQQALPPPTATPPTLPLLEAFRVAPAPRYDCWSLAREMDLLAADETPAPEPPDVGTREEFWASDLDGGAPRPVTAVLHAVEGPLQAWVEEGVAMDVAALGETLRDLRARVIPAIAGLYDDSARSPFSARDPLVLLHVRIRGAAAYYTLVHTCPPSLYPHSHARTTIVVNASAAQPGSPSYIGTLAHELQHVMQHRYNGGQETWLNEGLSEYARALVGQPPQPSELAAFHRMGGLSLIHWPDDGAHTAAHYAGAYLFVRYLSERYGEAAVRAIARQPLGGMAGVEAALREIGVTETFGDLYADWALAQAPAPFSAAEELFASSAQARPETVGSYPHELSATVGQYGARYYALAPAEDEAPLASGALRIDLAGQPHVSLGPEVAGEAVWCALRADGSHTWLERTLDLTELESPVLQLRLWHDLEQGWDYAYARASGDGGRTWAWLRGAAMTDANPSGLGLAAGYTGRSGGGPEAIWVDEEIDLSAYSGQTVIVRLEQITDDAVTRTGLCLQHAALDDAEASPLGLAADGWTAHGYLRYEGPLAQHYIVQLVTRGPQGLRVERLPVDADGRGAWTITGFGDDVEGALLIVSGATPYAQAPAEYTLRLGYVAEAGD